MTNEPALDERPVTRAMLRYTVKPDRLAEHLRLLRAVYEELGSTRPDGLRYATFQLEDEVSFVELVTGADLPGPLSRSEAFRRYRADLDARCVERRFDEPSAVGSFGFPDADTDADAGPDPEPPLRVGIIVGSTRPGRHAAAVAEWVAAIAGRREDASFELVDLVDYALPHLDEPLPPLAGEYARSHTQAWAATIDAFDAFVFVTPEYNHSTSGALKNAIDFLFAEWNDKAAGFVSYGVDGGVRAVEHLRQVLGELKVADVHSAVSLTFADDFEGYERFSPGDAQEAGVTGMLDELVAWATALRTVRAPVPG